MTTLFSASDALDALVDYALSSEFSFIVEEMQRCSSFEEWSSYVLSETAYGAASVLAFKNASDSEMLRDLRELWDAHS
jgi:hypothetical protein